MGNDQTGKPLDRPRALSLSERLDKDDPSQRSSSASFAATTSLRHSLPPRFLLHRTGIYQPTKDQ